MEQMDTQYNDTVPSNQARISGIWTHRKGNIKQLKGIQEVGLSAVRIAVPNVQL